MHKSGQNPLRGALRVLQVAFAVVLILVIGVLLAGTVPSVLGYESFVVYSGSMEPAIHVGDLAVVGPTRTEDLKVNDIITYRTPDRPGVVVTHRLMDIGTDSEGGLTFTTKGDANQSSDRVGVDPGAVLGKVAYSIPVVGYLVDFSKRSEGKVLLLGVPGLWLAVDYLFSSRRRRKSPAESAPRTEAVGLVVRARAALREDAHANAAVLLDRAVSLDPHLDEAWLLKSQCLADPHERLTCLRTALTINPSSALLKQAIELASTTEVAR